LVKDTYRLRAYKSSTGQDLAIRDVEAQSLRAFGYMGKGANVNMSRPVIAPITRNDTDKVVYELQNLLNPSAP